MKAMKMKMMRMMTKLLAVEDEVERMKKKKEG